MKKNRELFSPREIDKLLNLLHPLCERCLYKREIIEEPHQGRRGYYLRCTLTVILEGTPYILEKPAGGKGKTRVKRWDYPDRTVILCEGALDRANGRPLGPLTLWKEREP